MKFQNKNILLILASILAIGAFSVWFYWHSSASQQIQKLQNQQSNTSTPTPISKVYRNTEFGFEFEYPNEWVIVREDESINYYSRFLLMISAPVISNGETKLDSAFNLNITLPEFPDRSFKNIDKKISEVLIAGVQGLKYEYIFNNFSATAIILPLKEYKMILGTGDGSKEYLDEFNQILASFKFSE